MVLRPIPWCLTDTLGAVAKILHNDKLLDVAIAVATIVCVPDTNKLLVNSELQSI